VSSVALEAGPGGSLADRAYDALEIKLVTLELQPGAWLREQALVEQIGLGRTPVREAVLRLAGSGILSVLPRKGLLVAPVIRSELQAVIETRRVLERLMVVKAAERATESQRDGLRSVAQRIEASADDLPVFYHLDHELDERLEQCSQNPFLVTALSPLHIHCRRFWYLVRDRLDLALAASLHAALATAVAENDGAGAIRSLNGIIAMLEQQLGGLADIG